ncbi:MAG: M50 family metallopeptidase [Chloroflexota bacterium]|nr:MAG: hypothetical protein DIU68_07180 [Chloroflexota bacterium]
MVTRTSLRRRALWMSGLALVIVFIIWNVPQLNVLMFPFRLFVTFVHEAGHGLAAILSGGRFISFTINANGSGFATTAGGNPALILPAGYLSAALFGAILFYLAHRVPYPRHISLVLGALVMVIAVAFGGLLSLATLFGAAIGLALIVLGLKGSYDANLLTLNLLAVLTGLNGVLDLLYLVGSSHATVGRVRNDALAFQQEVMPLVPAPVWAFIWAALALIILGIAVYYSIIHPWRR